MRSPARLTLLAGKEGTKPLVRATGEVTDPTAYRTDYGYRLDPWPSLVQPVPSTTRSAGKRESLRAGRGIGANPDTFGIVAGKARPRELLLNQRRLGALSLAEGLSRGPLED